MSSDEKVLDFPRVEVTPEENARRVTVEAARLASLAPGEWRLWIDRSAERLRIPRATLQGLIVAIIKDSEKKARDAETAARRQELAVRREQARKQREQERIDKKAERDRKEKEKAFERLISLPSEQHETKLAELAKRFDEDVAAIRDDFTVFVGMESSAASTDQLRDALSDVAQADRGGRSGHSFPTRRADDPGQHRQLVRQRLPGNRLARLLIAFWPPHLHYPSRPAGPPCRCLVARCTAHGGPPVDPDHPAVHRRRHRCPAQARLADLISDVARTQAAGQVEAQSTKNTILNTAPLASRRPHYSPGLLPRWLVRLARRIS